jgi:hypothetical protein
VTVSLYTCTVEDMTSATTNTNPTPQDGDVVILSETGSYYAAKPGQRATVQVNLYGGNGTVGVCFNAHTYRPRGSASVSCSGGPLPCIKVSDLTYLGTTENTFWEFKDGIRRAHNGVDYTETVNLWSWEGEK